MKLYSETLAVISTGHVSEDDAAALTDGAAKEAGGLVREFGWQLSTHRALPDLPSVNYVLGYAKAQGFDWVLFDADADKSEELDEYDW